MSKNRAVWQQTPIKVLGEFKQLFGGATTWITLLIFVFSAISAWNTHTLTIIRESLPWLSLPLFGGIILVGLVVTMWMEHKFVQPSVMVYWNRMFYNHGNPMRERLESIEAKLDILLKEQGQGALPMATTIKGTTKRKRAA